MDIHNLRRYIAARDAISILETVDVVRNTSANTSSIRYQR